MLSKRENRVMGCIYSFCKDKSSALVSPVDIIKACGDLELNERGLERVMNDLAMDGYFDLIYSDRHGERVYCITLLDKGKAFRRSEKIMKRNLIFRLCLTLVLAVVSFLVGLILKAVF